MCTTFLYRDNEGLFPQARQIRTFEVHADNCVKWANVEAAPTLASRLSREYSWRKMVTKGIGEDREGGGGRLYPVGRENSKEE